jgi:plasmid stabilization system protein ParE
MYKLTITELADADLDEIINYIANKLNAPQAATTFANEVDACYNRIQLNPFICEAARDPRLKGEGYRKAVIKNYVMLYKVFLESEEVVVYRFFYGRRDYINLI